MREARERDRDYNVLFCFKVLAAPAKLCASGSVSSNFPAARFHGTHQDSEMDVAWQELMAITEMQVISFFFFYKYVVEMHIVVLFLFLTTAASADIHFFRHDI